MNPIRTIRRLACILTGLAATLTAAVIGAPAAFAQQSPPPGPPANRFGPLLVPHTVPAYTHAATTGGLAGWQITLIVVGAAILAAIVAMLVYRARAARSHRPATAA